MYRGYAPRARAAIFLRFEDVTHKVGNTINRPVYGYYPWLFLKSAYPATARLFLTPHLEHHTNLKNRRKIDVRSPASYYAIPSVLNLVACTPELS
jgi:hypothetical protein